MMLTLLSGADAFANTAEEAAVKAAFVFNFAVFTEWPDGAFENPSDVYHLCVVGEKSLELAFRAIDGKKIGSRALRVSYMEKPGDLERCHIVFIGQDFDHAALLRIFAAVRGKPVLTIGEKKDFTRLGGIVNFINKDSKLRFEINPDTARRHDLRISSRLLKLAVIVEDK